MNSANDSVQRTTFPRQSATLSNFIEFKKFVLFFSELFSKPGFLDDVACRDSYKEYVPNYYGQIFGPSIKEIRPRHLKWFRRLAPIFALPRGSTIVDYGGGYGLDSIFLASLGYNMVFYEITAHHIAIAQSLAAKFSERFHPLSIQFVLAGEHEEPSNVDVVLFNEVAHHIEPVQQVFRTAAKMLGSNGYLYLLEPNYLCLPVQAYFFKVRGFDTVQKRVDEKTGQQYLWGNENIRLVSTWTRHAQAEGLTLREAHYVIPWFMHDEQFQPSRFRQYLEKMPITRHLLASHVMLCYQKH